MKISTILRKVIPAILFIVIITHTYWSFTNSSGPMGGYSHAPSDSYCGTSGCHTPASSGSNFFTNSSDITLDNGLGTFVYKPGVTYTMKMTVTRPGHVKFGFQLTALDSAKHKMAGSFTITNSATTQTKTNFAATRTYVEHTYNGTSGTNTISWSFKWTAPKPAVGPVVFYCISNATNNDGSSYGDTIVAKEFTFHLDTSGLPAPKFSYYPLSPCTGDTVHFVDSSTNSPTSWAWTFQNGSPGTSALQGPACVFNNPGKDSVTLTVTNGNGTSKALRKYINITQLPADSVSVSGSTTLCQGSILKLKASAGLSYLWSTNDTTQSINVTSGGSYSVKVSNGNCVTQSKTIVVTLVPKPIVSISRSKDTACGGDSVTFTATSGLSNYNFYQNGVSVQDGPMNTYVATNLQNKDSFYVVAQNLQGCQSDPSNKVTVAVPAPLGTPAPSCNTVTTTSILFTWGQVAGAAGYEISKDSGKSWQALSGGGSDTTYSVTGLTYDTYISLYVRAFNHTKCKYSNSGNVLCKTSSCSGITYNLNFDKDICAGNTATLHFSHFSVSHYSVSVNGSSPLKDTLFMVAPDADSLVHISIVDSLSLSCPAATSQEKINIHKILTMAVKASHGDSTYCIGDPIALTATRGYDHYTLARSTDGINFTTQSTDTASVFNIKPFTAVATYVYKVTGTNNYGCGGGSATKKITIAPLPDPGFTFSTLKKTLSVTDTTKNEVSRIWLFGDNDSGTSATQSHTYTSIGTYKVILKSFSAAGCTDTVSHFVTITNVGIDESHPAIRDAVVYPNPTHNSFAVDYSLIRPGDIYVKVINLDGNTVTERSFFAEEGHHSLNLELNDAPAGVYFLQFISSEGVSTFKLLKN